MNDLEALFEQFKLDEVVQANISSKFNADKEFSLSLAEEILDWILTNPQSTLINKVLDLEAAAKKEWTLYAQNFIGFDEDFDTYRVKYIFEHWAKK